jgi:hypothetical protein
MLAMAMMIIAFFNSCMPGGDEWRPRRTIVAGKMENMQELAYSFQVTFRDSSSEETGLARDLTRPGGKSATFLSVTFHDPLSVETSFMQNLMESGGMFHATHECAFAQEAMIGGYGASSITVHVSPGDSIFITIDGAKLAQGERGAVSFSGDGALLNSEIYRWMDYSSGLKIPEFNPESAPEEYLQAIKRCLDAARDTIDAFPWCGNEGELARRRVMIDYTFLVASCLQDYEDKASKWRVYTDAIFDVYNEQNFGSTDFIFHLSECWRALVDGDPEIQALFWQEESHAAFRAVMAGLSAKAPRGGARDIMLYALARRMLGREPGLLDSVPGLDAFFSHPLVLERLKSLAQENASRAKKPGRLTGPEPGAFYPPPAC